MSRPGSGRRILLPLMLLVILATFTLAIAAGARPDGWHFAGGAGAQITGAQQSLHSAIGQPVAGIVSGTSAVLCSGYLCGAHTEGSGTVFLPVVLR